MKLLSLDRSRVENAFVHFIELTGPRVTGFAEGVSVGLALCTVLAAFFPMHHAELAQATLSEASLVLANAFLAERLEHFRSPTDSGHD